MPISVKLRQIVDDNPVPEIFDSDIKEKVFTHRSLYPIPAHTRVTEAEPRDWERYVALVSLEDDYKPMISDWLFLETRFCQCVPRKLLIADTEKDERATLL